MTLEKENAIKLLKTVKGQIEGLIKMCDENRNCLEISNQILASQSILKKVNLDILKGHFNHCVKETFENGNEKDKDAQINEIIMVLNKILK